MDVRQKRTGKSTDPDRPDRCGMCGSVKVEKGRAMDGRRCYRCRSCRNVWSCGMQGRTPRHSPQRLGFQFRDLRM